MKQGGFITMFLPAGWQIWAIGVACAASFGSGVWVTKKFWDASEAAAVNAALAMERGNASLVIRTETVIQEKIIRIKEKGKEIVREVPKIITVEVEKACPSGLPTGFVRVHDAAAKNEPAGAASELDARPAGVTLTAAAEVVSDNYTEYQTCRAQVLGWQEFYRSLQKRMSGE